MGLLDHKIESTDITTFGVVAAPDRLTGSAEDNKKIFDRLIRESVKGDFNAIIDLLVAVTAAAELGFQRVEGLEADTIQQAIEILHEREQELTPDYEELIRRVEELTEAAENYKDAAAGSASSASGSATSAAGSATEAGQSATSAAGSADAASGSAGTAAQKAEEASQSAAAAAGSASTANQKANEASQSADAAALSANAAAGSAAEAVRVVSDSVVGAIRHDVSQDLTDAQKAQARSNIGAYAKPASGIPKADLASDVQGSLGKADIALPKSTYDTFLLYMHNNCPRFKDITAYYNDGTLWSRLNGTNGFSLYEDIFVGDYFKMSRAISAYERTGQYQATGSDWVTIAGIDCLNGNGDNVDMMYHHLVMVPGKGADGTQHFGRSRMNASHTTTGGYIGSEMYTTTIGPVATSGATGAQATINQQLYAEFGSHLKTTRELLSNAMNGAYYNKTGQATGATSGWAWESCQAVLMSEIEVYGSEVWSSSGYDTGNAWPQLPLFRLSKKAANNRTAYYWLKSVSSASFFCFVTDGGSANYGGAGSAYLYVRPRFVLGA